jgi:hypothetical protein
MPFTVGPLGLSPSTRSSRGEEGFCYFLRKSDGLRNVDKRGAFRHFCRDLGSVEQTIVLPSHFITDYHHHHFGYSFRIVIFLLTRLYVHVTRNLF